MATKDPGRCSGPRSRASARTISRIDEGEDPPMAMAPEQIGIGIRRYFTQPGTHPYDTVEWERRDARIPNFKDGDRRLLPARRRVPGHLVAERHQHRRPEVLPRHARHRRARALAAPGHRPRRRHDHRVGRRATATSSTTQEGAAFRNELKYVLAPPARRVQLAGVVQHRREGRPAAGERVPAVRRARRARPRVSSRSASSSRTTRSARRSSTRTVSRRSSP